MAVRREVDVEASPEEVWEALATEEGRERWLGEPGRDIEVELEEEPRRLVWWWAGDEEQPTRVEFVVHETDAGARVVVTESVPDFPIATLAASFALVAA
ncbi:MAG: SRPBCC family protein [Solirubrobacteraceae bacterium]